MLAEAEAVHRQDMARIAQAVAAGMSDKDGYKEFITSLELSQSKADIQAANWEMLTMRSPKKKR